METIKFLRRLQYGGKKVVLFIFIPFERQIARLTGKLRRERKMKLADAAIAASALYLGTPLITRNKKDFRIKGLALIDWL